MPHSTWLLMIVTAGLACPDLASAESGWRILRQGPGLVVYDRPVDGSHFREHRGVIRVRARLSAIVAVFQDASANHEWVYRSLGAEVLRQESPLEAFVYGRISAPWPIEDRDSVVRFQLSQDPESLAVRIGMRAEPGLAPRYAGFVRVPVLDGHWLLRPMGDGTVEVSHQVYGEPGGWVPAWLANEAATRTVYYTLLNLRAMAVDSRYSDVRLSYIVDPARPTP